METYMRISIECENESTDDSDTSSIEEQTQINTLMAKLQNLSKDVFLTLYEDAAAHRHINQTYAMHKYKFKSFAASVDIFAKAIIKVYNLQKDIESNKGIVTPEKLKKSGRKFLYEEKSEIKNGILIKEKIQCTPEKLKKTVSFKPKINVALFDSAGTPADVSLLTSPKKIVEKAKTNENSYKFTKLCLAILPGPAKILSPVGLLIDKMLE